MPNLTWLNEEMRDRLVDLFERHGVSRAVSLVATTGGDEVVFVVAPADAAMMDETGLTAALTDLLKRKVWITTNGSLWGDALVPLAPERR
jgi:hypothetical protein